MLSLSPIYRKGDEGQGSYLLIAQFPRWGHISYYSDCPLLSLPDETVISLGSGPAFNMVVPPTPTA